MIWKWFRLVILLIITGMIYFVCQVGLPFLDTPLPALGKLVNPFTGFWKNNAEMDNLAEVISAQKLSQPVEVLWDERNVPHIFAENNYDLYYTQGYVTAKNRLWQMDFISRVSSGRVAEVVGPKAANFDQFHRRIGLPYASKLSLDTLKTSPKEFEALQAYAQGVNDYIDQLSPEDYPIEFKILNYKPEHWSPYKSVLIMKYMAWDLDGGTKDRYITNAKAALPDEVFEDAFPLLRPGSEPIVPQQPVSTRRNSISPRYIPYQSYDGGYFNPNQYQKGSNNWVVNGSKTRSGKPILANDPHLGLSLPSIWFENQLNSPDCNVYGVSLPGVPMVVIGFNQDVAWGLTYTTSDRIDFVKMELNEEKNQYRLNGKWENPLILEDTILIKGANKRINRTLLTDYGPIIYTDSIPKESYNHMIPDVNMAMNWTAIAPTLELKTMYQLNRAKNFEDYKAALPYFAAPGQNFVFASNSNDIAIWHNGRFPVRTAEEARFVNPKAQSDNKWNEFIPFDELPHSVNPSRGYLFSANQQPVGANYKYYLGTDAYAEFERANRINEVLDSLKNIVPDDFKRLQLDKKSMLAEKIMPLLTSVLDQANLSSSEQDVLSELKNWDKQFTATAKATGFFYHWLLQLRKDIWVDEAKPESRDKSWWLPFNDVTANLLLTDTLSTYFDNKTTPQVETYKSVIVDSYKKAVRDYSDKYGSLNDSWQWQNVNPTKINSLADMAGFGARTPLVTGGHGDAVNAIDGDHGPSWRMIVSLSDDGPTAYGVYPGGQSGNPGSPDYENFVDTWGRGDYYKLHLLPNKDNVDIPVTKTKLTPSK